MSEMDNRCNRKDCFGNKDGMCMPLSDTRFKGKECPFFKTKEQRYKELRESNK